MYDAEIYHAEGDQGEDVSKPWMSFNKKMEKVKKITKGGIFCVMTTNCI